MATTVVIPIEEARERTKRDLRRKKRDAAWEWEAYRATIRQRQVKGYYRSSKPKGVKV